MLSRAQKIKWIEKAVEHAQKTNIYRDDVLYEKLYDLLFYPEETSFNTLVHAANQLLISDAITLTTLCKNKISGIKELSEFTLRAVRPEDREIFILAHIDQLKAYSPKITNVNIGLIGSLFFGKNYQAFKTFATHILLGQKPQQLTKQPASLFFKSHKQYAKSSLASVPSFKQ